MTHTPGPWRVDSTINGPYVRSDNAAVLKDDGIAKVLKGRFYSECNARLIAAAPELLEALKRLIDYEDNPTEGQEGYFLIGDADFARAAIAKAEGK